MLNINIAFCEEYSFFLIENKSSIEILLRFKGGDFEEENRKKVFYIIHSQQNYMLVNGLTSLLAIFSAAVFFSIVLAVIEKDSQSYEKLKYDFAHTYFNTSLASFNHNLQSLQVIFPPIALLPLCLFDYHLYVNKKNIFLNLTPYLVIVIAMNSILYKNNFYSKTSELINHSTDTEPTEQKKYVCNDRSKIVLMFNGPYLIALIIQMTRWYYVYKNINNKIDEALNNDAININIMTQNSL